MRYTLLPCVEPACICAFIKANQRTHLQILIHNSAAIPDLNYTQIIIFTEQHMRRYSDLDYT